MNVKEVVQMVIEALVAAGIASADKIFAGRIFPENVSSGLWSVRNVAPATTDGGNLAQWKTRWQLQVYGYDTSAVNLYDQDEAIAQALAALPLQNSQVLSVATLPMVDGDIVGNEVRVGTWNINLTTAAKGWPQ